MAFIPLVYKVICFLKSTECHNLPLRTIWIAEQSYALVTIMNTTKPDRPGSGQIGKTRLNKAVITHSGFGLLSLHPPSPSTPFTIHVGRRSSRLVSPVETH